MRIFTIKDFRGTPPAPLVVGLVFIVFWVVQKKSVTLINLLCQAIVSWQEFCKLAKELSTAQEAPDHSRCGFITWKLRKSTKNHLKISGKNGGVEGRNLLFQEVHVSFLGSMAPTSSWRNYSNSLFILEFFEPSQTPLLGLLDPAFAQERLFRILALPLQLVRFGATGVMLSQEFGWHSAADR